MAAATTGKREGGKAAPAPNKERDKALVENVMKNLRALHGPRFEL